MARAPHALRLGFTLVDDGFYLARNIADQLDVSARRAHGLLAAYTMSEPEKAFARRLLKTKRNLWLYRCHQRRYCGDFAILDQSGRSPAGRRVVVAELKERKALEIGVAPGNQLKRAHEVVAELVADDRLTARSEVLLAIGDSDELYDWLDDDWSDASSG